MATIRERKPGIWEVRTFTGRDGRGRPTQVSRTVRGTKKDAKRVAAENTLRPATSAGRTVADLLDLWIEHSEHAWAPQTRSNQVSRVALVCADAVGRISLAKLSVSDVERWHRRLQTAGTGDWSIRNQHAVLRAALTQAVRWGWITMNPATIARLEKRKQSSRGALTPEEVRRVIAAATEIDLTAGVALRLAAATGARRGELAALRWDDLTGNRLLIDSSLVVLRHGRRGAPETPTLRDDPTKTANRRTITLDPSTAALLDAHRREREALGPWILAVGDRPVNPERITAWWRRAARDAGLPTQWRLHDLRHWSATMAISHGHDIRTVANRLGHANPAMTLRVYAHAVEAPDLKLAESLGAELDA